MSRAETTWRGWTRWSWVVISLVATCARAQDSASATASAYQASYDAEATGQFEAALLALENLSRPQHDAYLAQLRRGWLLTRLARHDDAVSAYGLAIAAEPASVEARLGALTPLVATRRWADAETMARQVLKADPANYTAGLKLAFTLYTLGRYPEALGAYRKVLGLYPGDLEVRSGVAWTLLKLGRGSEAVRAFSELLEVAPRQPWAAEGLVAARALAR